MITLDNRLSIGMKPAPGSHDARSLHVEPIGDTGEVFNLVFDATPEVTAALIGGVLKPMGEHSLGLPTDDYPYGFINNLTENEAREAIGKIGRNNYRDPRGILPLNK